MSDGGGTGRILELLGPSTGGIRRHIATLADGLRAGGWHVAVAGPAGVMDGVGRQDHVVPVGTSPRTVVTGGRTLARLARDVDLVHAHGLAAGWLAVLAIRRTPVVVTLHNVVLDEAAGRSAPVLRRLERALPARVARTIAVSGEIAGRFRGTRGGARMTVIAPAGPDPEPDRSPAETRAALGVGVDTPLVVSVARLHPQKDIPTLLDAAVVVHARQPSAAVMVVGDGPQRSELEQQCAAMGLDGLVRFVGARANAANELAAADVVALSSRWEGSPLVVAEALRLGRPVVATAVGAVPEVVVDGVTGRLVPPGDGTALGHAVADLLADPDAARALAEAGQALACERFAISRLVDEVAGVYRAVLAEGR
jgi:glycosyltransferase involved in cell wall biosynthesis